MFIGSPARKPYLDTPPHAGCWRPPLWSLCPYTSIKPVVIHTRLGTILLDELLRNYGGIPNQKEHLGGFCRCFPATNLSWCSRSLLSKTSGGKIIRGCVLSCLVLFFVVYRPAVVLTLTLRKIVIPLTRQTSLGRLRRTPCAACVVKLSGIVGTPSMAFRNAYGRFYTTDRCIVYHFVWQNGTSKDDMITAAAAAENESVVVVGYHRDDSGFLAAKLSGDGTLLWEWEVRTPSCSINTYDKWMRQVHGCYRKQRTCRRCCWGLSLEKINKIIQHLNSLDIVVRCLEKLREKKLGIAILLYQM